jgi:hypothetical protein
LAQRNVLPALIAAARARASIGQMRAAMNPPAPQLPTQSVRPRAGLTTRDA